MKLLIVTFPNDLGSRTIEENLIKLIAVRCDCKIFRFAAHDCNEIDYKISHKKNILRRIQDALRLRKVVKKAIFDKRKILFYNVSPAFFSYGSWSKGEIYITMDWASLLFNDHVSILRKIISHIHKHIFKLSSGLLPMTQAMANCLQHKYDVSKSKIHLVPSLFDVTHFDPGYIRKSDRLRVLFIGGDIERKGGHLLYSAYKEYLHQYCNLTMVTNHDLPDLEGFKLVKNIRYGTKEHLSLMQEHDIFVLPTFRDSGPQAIGEAASAGLAVLTTEQALGSSHVVIHGKNGLIASDPIQCINELRELIKYPEKVFDMRQQSLLHMRSFYSKDQVFSSYYKALNQ
jgi:glycosyltransferase involved in cell wall biosynthesis